MEDFEEELFSCNKTPGLFCFLALFSCVGGPCCVQGKVLSEYSDKGCVYHCILSCCCLCVGASINRQILRKKLGTDKPFIIDCCLHLFCGVCAVNQEFLESHKYKSKGTLNLLPVKKKKRKYKQGRISFTPDAPIDYN
jgi:Cys-rich protein (TIGR01571 family)